MQIMVNKKSQTKIQQTAVMLIAVTLFFVLVGLFVLSFRLSGLKNEATTLQEQNAILLVTKLSNSPEFSCGESFSGKKINCVDADKIMMLREDITKYNNFWGVADIKIRKIYPTTDGDVECTLSNYPQCNVINLIQKGVVGTYESSFVTLCRKEIKDNSFYDKCELARLMVSYKTVQ
jgi:hypothetical protein